MQASTAGFVLSAARSLSDAGLRTLLHADLGFVYQLLFLCREDANALSEKYLSHINTLTSFFVGVLIRYGSQVLMKEEYRRAIRVCLRQYWWLLFKAKMKASRRKDKIFQ